MAKKDLNNKKELAKILYYSGKSQTEIAEQISVSKITLTRWVNDNGWKKVRAAQNITRPELVNKLLLSINNILDKINEDGNADALSGASDKLSKLASVVEKLDKKANVVDAIETFIAFNKWIIHRALYDPEITPELIKAINKYQDLFISEMVNQKIEV